MEDGVQDVAELDVDIVGQDLFRVLGEIGLGDRLVPDAVIAAAGGVFQELERGLWELRRVGDIVGEEGMCGAGPDLADDHSERRKNVLAGEEEQLGLADAAER